MTEDFYDVLGVSRDASEEEIQQAYREKASEYHPDVSDDPDAEEKFKKIKKAKEVLTDEEKRQAYDRMGHERFKQAEKRGGFDEGAAGGGAAGGRGRGRAGGGGDPFGGGPFGGGAGSVEDIFEQVFGGMGGGGRGGNRPQSGRDLRTELHLDLEEAYHGVEKELTVTRPQRCPSCDGAGHPADADARTCPECSGRGQVRQVQQTPFGRVQQTGACPRCEGDGEIYEETCGECGGDGVVREEATLSVEVPAGIEDGQTIRKQGEGAPGERGARAGDLLIDVSVRDHEEFERDGEDLHHHLAVSVPQATFGDTVEVPTPDGAVEIEIPEGTQSGERITVDGEGMPRLRRRGSGDLIVHVQVVTPDPDDLSEEQREALETFAEAGGEEIDVGGGFWEKVKQSF